MQIISPPLVSHFIFYMNLDFYMIFYMKSRRGRTVRSRSRASEPDGLWVALLGFWANLVPYCPRGAFYSIAAFLYEFLYESMDL